MDLNNIPEAVTPNEDGSYTIFINTQFNVERQREAALHAICHIINKDFDKIVAMLEMTRMVNFKVEKNSIFISEIK